MVLQLLTLGLGLTACSGGGGGSSGGNNPSGPTPPTTQQGSAENIVLDPINLEQPDFGIITSTAEVISFLNIRNIGNSIISPITLALQGQDAGEFTLQTPTCPDLLPQSANVCTIKISFQPSGNTKTTKY